MELNNYKQRRQWSDAHLDKVRAIIGKEFIKCSSFKQDVEQGIDLFICNLTFAVRLRQLKYKAFTDFTLRSSGGGDRSEYAKMLLSTAPDFMFYGYTIAGDLSVSYIVDLKDWRRAVINGEVKPAFRRNKDGSHFVAFTLDYEYARQVA